MKISSNEMLATTLKISSAIERELIKRVIDDGLGMRGKSKWISLAIEKLLDNENFPEFVDLATDMDEQEKTISIRVSKDLVKKIDQAVITVRRKFPQMEGVRSHIIRTAIIHELLK